MQKGKGKAGGLPSCYEQVKSWLNTAAMQDVLTRSLPKGLPVGSWSEAALVYVRTSSEVQKCEPMSVTGSIITVASFGLRLDGIMGHAWLRAMPVKDKNGDIIRYDAQVQLGYKGLVDLAYRNPDVQDIEPVFVHAHDEFDFNKGTNPHLKHTWSVDKDRGALHAVYAGLRFKNGYFAFQIHPIGEIMKTRRRALEQSWIRIERQGDGERYTKRNRQGQWIEMKPWEAERVPWIGYFEPMALKTAIWRSHKFWPMVGTDFSRAASLVELDDEGLSQGMADVAAETMTDDMRNQAAAVAARGINTQTKTRQRGDAITKQMALQALKNQTIPRHKELTDKSDNTNEKSLSTEMTEEEIEEIMAREQEEWESEQSTRLEDK